MIPEKGQHVRCFMRSTMVLEGIVEDWADAQVVLKSLDGKSIMIVHRPAEDIMLTKIVLEPLAEEIPKETPKEWTETQLDIREKLQEVMSPTGDVEIDKLNIEQLQQLVQDQEKQIITQKRTEHFGTAGAAKRAVPYSNPFGVLKSAYKPGRLPNTPGLLMQPRKKQ